MSDRHILHPTGGVSYGSYDTPSNTQGYPKPTYPRHAHETIKQEYPPTTTSHIPPSSALPHPSTNDDDNQTDFLCLSVCLTVGAFFFTGMLCWVFSLPAFVFSYNSCYNKKIGNLEKVQINRRRALYCNIACMIATAIFFATGLMGGVIAYLVIKGIEEQSISL